MEREQIGPSAAHWDLVQPLNKTTKKLKNGSQILFHTKQEWTSVIINKRRYGEVEKPFGLESEIWVLSSTDNWCDLGLIC